MRIKELASSSIVRYFYTAAVLVVLEIIIFYALNSKANVNYELATIISTALIIVLNWYASRKIVFRSSIYRPLKELSLVAGGSVVGIAIQAVAIFIAVTHFHIVPLIGKGVAILVTFFWNFWFRKKYVFPI